MTVHKGDQLLLLKNFNGKRKKKKGGVVCPLASLAA